jgi:hypothetical protein
VTSTDQMPVAGAIVKFGGRHLIGARVTTRPEIVPEKFRSASDATSAMEESIAPPSIRSSPPPPHAIAALAVARESAAMMFLLTSRTVASGRSVKMAEKEMPKSSHETKRTLEQEIHPGNALFDLIARSMSMDAVMARRVLADALSTIGSAPSDATLDELGALLPEVDRRLRLIMPPEMANRATARLRRAILAWDEHPQ